MSPSSYTAVEDIVRIAPYAEIAHHLPGRIRLTIKLSGLGLVREIDLPAVLQNLPGVLSLRVNALARSVVIDYDPNRLPFDLWEHLVLIGCKPELEESVRERLLAVTAKAAPG